MHPGNTISPHVFKEIEVNMLMTVTNTDMGTISVNQRLMLTKSGGRNDILLKNSVGGHIKISFTRGLGMNLLSMRVDVIGNFVASTISLSQMTINGHYF